MSRLELPFDTMIGFGVARMLATQFGFCLNRTGRCVRSLRNAWRIVTGERCCLAICFIPLPTGGLLGSTAVELCFGSFLGVDRPLQIAIGFGNFPEPCVSSNGQASSVLDFALEVGARR